MGVQNGKDESYQEDYDQPAECEILDEPKRFDSLFGEMSVH
jgi:hypothetical protein